MKSIALYFILLLTSSIAEAREVQSTWIFVPDDSMSHEHPWRIIIYDDFSVLSHIYFFGCKRELGTNLKLKDSVIEIPTAKNESIKIHKEKDRLIFRQEHKDRLVIPGGHQDEAYDCVFLKNEEWNDRFEKAPSPPRNRKEALAVLNQILSQEDKDHLKGMKKEDLIKLHHGWGTGLRNGFDLWQDNSQIVKDYGGGHPDGVSMKLIEEYWATLQAGPKSQAKIGGAGQSSTRPESKPEAGTLQPR